MKSPKREDVRPSVMIVGGDDVHKRLELMDELRSEFSFSAAGSSPDLREEFEGRGFPYHHFPLAPAASPLADLRTVSSLIRIFRRVAPDVVHAFATKPSVWGRIAARRARVPVVVGTIPGLGSLYSSDDLKARVIRPIYEFVQRWACGISDMTIFQNETDRRQMVGSGICPEDKATVIPGSGIRIDRFRRSSVPPTEIRQFRTEVGADDGALLVTMVARVIRSKGVMEFARAASLVQERAGGVRFLLVGPEERGSVEALTEGELDEVRSQVRWIGEREDIPRILGSSDVFVLPSFYREGIPRVLIEAASMGLPLISHPNPGSVEVIRDGFNGLLVDAREEENLAEAILRLVRDPELRRTFGERGRRLVRERFDIRVIAKATGELYRAHLEGIAQAPDHTNQAGHQNLATPS